MWKCYQHTRQCKDGQKSESHYPIEVAAKGMQWVSTHTDVGCSGVSPREVRPHPVSGNAWKLLHHGDCISGKIGWAGCEERMKDTPSLEGPLLLTGIYIPTQR